MIDRMLHDTIAADPAGTAIVSGRERLSYRELGRRTAGFRRHLCSLGVGPGDHVLVVLPNCPEFVIAYLATAGLGATVEAVDRNSADHELLRHAREGQPAAVVTTAPRVPEVERLLAGGGVAPVVTAVGDHTRDPGIVPGEPFTGAWVVARSSGSTGEPTLVRRSQANQVAEADNILSSANVGRADVILCAVPLFHALGQFCCMLVAMRAGATLVLADGDAPAGDGDGIARVAGLVAEHRVTILPAVPYMFEALADLGPDEPADFSSVRLCLSGANFLSPAVRERFQARFGVPVRQTYGSTETGSVSWDCVPDEVVPESVGRPLGGVTVEILDEDGNPLPRGAIGEIAVGSAAVTTGLAGAEGRYHTGDLGWVAADGRLHVVGRIRTLIDTGGRKVNPVEVEEVLEQHPSVAAAAVTGMPLRGGGELLVAAVVPRGEADPATLREHCRLRMARHKVPRRFEFVREIPRSPLGKVRRARLAAMLGASGRADAWRLDDLLRERPAAERTAIVTEHLVRTMAEVLDVRPDAIDRQAPLRKLGLDSLGALRLRMALQRDLGRHVGLPHLLGAATIAGLAEGEGEGDADAPPVPRGDPDGEFPLSYNQLSIWHDDQLAKDDGRYNLSFAARIVSDLDVKALRRALQTLVDRHPMLRINVRVGGGVPRQRVAEDAAVDFAVAEVSSGWDDADGESLSREAFRPFDLETEAPLRVRLFTGPERGPLLLVTMHHVATDYWSLVTMLWELGAHYAAEAAGTEVYLPPPSHSYADYVRWLAQIVEGPAGQEDLVFWRERLRDLPPPPELPADMPRPPVQQRQRATLFHEFGRDCVASLRAFARAHGTTVYAVLLATFHLLLYGDTGERDVPVAVITTSRQRDEFRDVLGLFVNPMVSRVRVDPEQSFSELVERTRASLLDGMAHQMLPIEVIVERIGVVRDRSRAPLVEIAFGQNKAQSADLLPLSRFLSGGQGQRLRLGSLVLESVAMRQRGVSYDFSGAVYESDDAIAIAWEYNTGLFTPATVQRLAAALETVARTACASPGLAVGEIDTMNEAERERLLEASRGPAPREPDRTVLDLIAESAAARLDAVAVETAAGRMTYRELDERAGGLARAVLDALGPATEPGAHVAIWLEASAELAVAGLGVLRAGMVADAIDWDAAPEQVRARAGVRLLVTTSAGCDRLGGCDVPVLCVEDAGSDLAPRAVPPIAPQAPAVVLRTSGACGPSRAAVLGHRALARHALALPERCGPLGEVLIHGALAADRALVQVLSVAAAGGTAVLTTKGASPDELAALLDSGRRFTLVTLTPTELALVLPRLGPVVAAPTLLLSGETLPGHLVHEWRARTGDGRVVHAYGCAEVALTVSAWEVPAEVLADEPVPVGRPVGGVERYVLDSAGRLCPVGVPGEICVATVDLPAPHRTGDVGRYLDSGDVVVLGRACQRTTVRGYHVDLGQVEAALRRLPEVVWAVVVHGGEDAAPVAHVVAHDERTTPGSLRAALRQVVPEYMVPAEIVIHERLPSAANGKAACTGLTTPATPDPAESSDTVREGDTAKEQSPIEALLTSIWQEVLGVERVGPDDDYWAELGGDSVTALQIVSRAAEAGLPITPRQVFTHPTVRQLATVAEVTSTALPTPNAHQPGVVPLTPIQRWFFDQDLANVHHWNQAVLLRTRRPVDRALLRRAVLAVAERHSAFRLRFHRTGDGWEQVLDPRAAPILILDHDPPRDGPLPQDLLAAAHARLDITAGPVLTATVLSSPLDTSLLLVAHHLVIDFVSWRIVVDDLERAYGQLAAGAQVELPPVATPFPRWARLLAAPARSWSRPATDSFPERHTRIVTGWLSRTDTASLLRGPAGRQSPQPHELVLAAVARAVTVWMGENAVRIDVEGHGRDGDLDLSRTVGWLTAVRPLHLEFDPAVDPAGVLDAVVDAMRRPAGHGLPAATVGFNYLGRLGDLLRGEERGTASERWFELAPLPSGHERSPRNRRPYPLEITASIHAGLLVVNVAHCQEQFLGRDANQLAADVLDGLRALIAGQTSWRLEPLEPEPVPDAGPAPDPADDFKAQVRALWAGVLGHDDFTEDDDFFAIGGHSLLVARIMAGLGELCGRRLPLRLFFDQPTVSGLAAAVASRRMSADA